MNTTPPDDEFLPPADFTPHVRTPGWVVYAPLSPQAHSAAGYLYGHVNPDDGTFTVIPSHASIAKYLGVKSENSARKYINELKDAGVLDAVLTFYDRKAKKRTTQRVREDGVKNDQTSNTYRLRWAPPRGRMHPGPMNSDEWHHPDKIEKRLRAEEGRQQADQPSPPQHSEGGRNQEKREFSQVDTPLNAVRGAPSTEWGDPPHSVEDEVEQGEENKRFQPTTGAGEAADSESGDSDNTGWMEGSAEGDKDSDHQTVEAGSVDGSTQRSAGAMLVARLERRYSAHLHAGRDRHVQVVDEALAVLTRSEVTAVLGDGLETAIRPSGALVSRLEALPQRVAARQAQHQERADWQRRAEANAERNQAASRPNEPEQEPQQQPSPVDWLTDKQYAELRKADQVQLRVWSEATEERFSAGAPARLVALRNKVTAAHEGDAA